MKVTVCFDAVHIVVPCGDGSLTVRNLIEAAVTRYRKAKGNAQRLRENAAKVSHAEVALHQNALLPVYFSSMSVVHDDRFLSIGNRKSGVYDVTSASPSDDLSATGTDSGYRKITNCPLINAVLANGIEQGCEGDQVILCRLLRLVEPSDNTVIQVHSLRSVQNGGILDPDDQVSTVLDDREQIVAVFDEQDSPVESSAYYRLSHHSADATSASSAGTSSPDIYPQYAFNKRGGSNHKFGTDTDQKLTSGNSRVTAKKPSAYSNGHFDSTAYQLLPISQAGMSPRTTPKFNGSLRHAPTIASVDQDHMVEILDFNEHPVVGLLVVDSDAQRHEAGRGSSRQAQVYPEHQRNRSVDSLNSDTKKELRNPVQVQPVASVQKHVRIASSTDDESQQGASQYFQQHKKPTNANHAAFGDGDLDSPHAESGAAGLTLSQYGSLPHGFSQFQRNSARKSRITDKWLDAAERVEEHYWTQSQDDTKENEFNELPTGDFTQSGRSAMEVLYMTLAYDGQRDLGIATFAEIDDLTGGFSGLRVSQIESNTRCSVDGRIKVGDRIVQVNGQSLVSLTPSTAQQLLSNSANNGALTLQLIRQRNSPVCDDVSPNVSYKPFAPYPIFPLHSFSPKAADANECGEPLCHKTPPSNSHPVATSTPSAPLRASDLEFEGTLTKWSTPGNLAANRSVSTPNLLGDTLQRANTRKLGKKIAVSLKKGSEGLGFTVTSRDNFASSDNPICIKTILPTGAAIVDGRLKAGDRLLQINDVEINGMHQDEVVRLLRNIGEGELVELIVSRQESVIGSPLLPRPITSDKLFDVESETSPCSSGGSSMKRKKMLTFDIMLNSTGSAGLGVSVKGKTRRKPTASDDGAEDVMLEDQGIFIQNIMHGGAAYNDGRLRVNDQLAAINDEQLLGYSNDEAMALLRRIMPSIGASASSVKLAVFRRVDCDGLPVSASPHSSSTVSPVPRDIGSNNQVEAGSSHGGRISADVHLESSKPSKISASVPHFCTATGADYAIVMKSPVTVSSRRVTEVPEVPPRTVGRLSPCEVEASGPSSVVVTESAQSGQVLSSCNTGHVPSTGCDNYESIPDSMSVTGSRSEPSIYDEVASDAAFDRDAPGRQSMSEKRKGAAKIDPTHTQTYQRIKRAKHERQPSAPTVLHSSSVSLSKATGFKAKDFASAISGSEAGVRRSLSLESVSASKAHSAFAGVRKSGEKVSKSELIDEIDAHTSQKPTPAHKSRPLSQFFPLGSGKKVSRNRPTNDSFKRAVDRSYANGKPYFPERTDVEIVHDEKGVDVENSRSSNGAFQMPQCVPKAAEVPAQIKGLSGTNIFKNLFRIRDKKTPGPKKNHERNSLHTILDTSMLPPQSKLPYGYINGVCKPVSNNYEEEQRRIREELEKLKRNPDVRQHSEVWARNSSQSSPNHRRLTSSQQNDLSSSPRVVPHHVRGYSSNDGCRTPPVPPHACPPTAVPVWQHRPIRRDYEDAEISGSWAYDNRMCSSLERRPYHPSTANNVPQLQRLKDPPQSANLTTDQHYQRNIPRSSTENGLRNQSQPLMQLQQQRRCETASDLRRNESPLRCLVNGAEGKFQRNGSLSINNRPSMAAFVAHRRDLPQSSILDRQYLSSHQISSQQTDKVYPVEECYGTTTHPSYQQLETRPYISSHISIPHLNPGQKSAAAVPVHSNGNAMTAASEEPGGNYQKHFRDKHLRSKVAENSGHPLSPSASRKQRPASNVVEYLFRRRVEPSVTIGGINLPPPDYPAPPIPGRRHLHSGITLPHGHSEPMEILYSIGESTSGHADDRSVAGPTYDYLDEFRRLNVSGEACESGPWSKASGLRQSESQRGPPVPPKPNVKKDAPVKIETYEFRQTTTVVKNSSNSRNYHQNGEISVRN